MEENKKSVVPRFAGEASMGVTAASRRSNSNSSAFSSSSDIAGMLSNLKDGVTPFAYENGDVNVKDAIILSRKAYWNVSIYKLTIDIMTEFANSPMHFVGKNKASLDFFKSWYNKINGWKLADQVFREMFRSSNIFLFRVNGNMSRGNKPSVKIPIRYILLDPAEIRCDSAATFFDSSYKKIINDFEAEVLRTKTDLKTLEFKRSLPLDVQKQIDKKLPASIPLDANSIIPVFFKKQDYEPLAVPIFFPVLFDINLKLEFKKAEQIIAKACEYMILLITVGDKENGVDQTLVDHLQSLFSSESVGRVLVSDWTTNMEFILPDLEKILGPAKYESVNKDISSGLMNIFFGESKYADSMAKIKIFLERLKEARKIYLEEIIKPEMERICEAMGFRDCPEPKFEEVDLKDEIEYMKIYNRMAEMGLLTDEETIKAHKTHILPEKYDSIVSQEQFKKEKDRGLYAPLAQSGQADDSGEIPKPAGRPTGTPQKQKQKKVTPVGQGSISVLKVKDTVVKMGEFYKQAEEAYKKKFKIQRMSKKHKDCAKAMARSVFINEEVDNWNQSCILEYFENPSKSANILNGVVELADTHKLDFVSASILYHSQNK